MTFSLVTLVLAGGRSSRMGQDKALLPWDGIPMLKRVGQVAAACTQQVFVLTPWPDRYQRILEPEWIQLTEPEPSQGPLMGLAQGFELLQPWVKSHSWILVLACDLPCLQSEVLRTWATQLSQIPTEHCALVPCRNGRWEPLCAYYRPQCQPYLQQFTRSGGRSFQRWLNQLPVSCITETPAMANMLWNCNTPSDYQHQTISDKK